MQIEKIRKKNRNIIVQQLTHPVNNADILEKVVAKLISSHNDETRNKNVKHGFVHIHSRE